ncbi:MAG: hypothetical protein R3F23_06315 [Verrucomicrobiia bacterium]
MATPVSLAIFFAVPHEAALFKKHLKIKWKKGGGGLFWAETLFRQQLILVACLGMGKEAVGKNLTFLLGCFTFSQAILAGYAGALDPKLKKGDVVVSDKRHLNLLPDLRLGKIISVDEVVATIEEKCALFEKTSASVCDMEYETVKTICQQRNIGVLSIRAISDTASEDLPMSALASAFDLQQQNSTPLKLCFHLIKQPKKIFPFFRFVKNLPQVRKQLTQALYLILANLFAKTN